KAVLSLWTDDPGMLAASGGGWLLFMLGAVLCRRGLHAELQEQERPLGSRRGRRLKRAGGAVVGVATAFTALFAAGHGLPVSIAFGLLATVGYFLLYDGERQQSALARRVPDGTGDEAAVLLRDAWRRLDGIEAASRRIGSGEFRQRLGDIVGGAERILKLVAEDPRDLRRARKFLTVYLDGTHRITEEYVRTHAAGAPAELEHNYRTLLVDMQNTCDEQYSKLLQHDASDLEVQIEVLSARLRREGVA
ncbi:MAG TPA: 5-bromo-4-chloroindolyl phosphate hydrolysis family protein, partial [Rhodospirillales bacterium]|nr:5-bromo-4-chloroindolyl phosphate hydrolysis family protein [Rhodospirillales bacterium]